MPRLIEFSALTAFLIATLAPVALAQAGPILSVDFGHTNPGNDVQAGFEFFSLGSAGGSGLNGVASPQTRTFTSDVGSGGSLDLTLSSPESPMTLGSRDRGDVTHALGDMEEDFIFNTETSDQMRLTLSTFPEGMARITTFFHDRNFAQGSLSVTVDDDLGMGRFIGSVLQSDGATPASISSLTFEVFTSGTDDVTLIFTEDLSASNVALAGMTMEFFQIPEPSTSLLTGIGLCVLARVGRRRRVRGQHVAG